MTPAAGYGRAVRRAWWRGLRLREGARGDDGQITVLALGTAVLVLLLVTVTVSATGVHLDRKRLLAMADLAALAAADEVSDDRYFGGSRGPSGVPLTDAGVRAAVEEYVTAHPETAARWDGVRVLEASTPDGRSVVVRLGAVTRPVLLTWVLAPWSDGIALEADAVARAS